MKIKAILLALTLSGLSVFGQGLVTFQNSGVSTPITVGGVAITGPGTYSFYFTYGLNSASLNQTSQTFLNENAGRITLTGTANIGLSSSPAFPGGTAYSFQLFAYSTAAGSYANAVAAPGAAWYTSAPILLTPSIGPSPGTPMFGAAVGQQFQGFNFNVNPIPEPSTIALGILGAGSLLVLRRKK